MTSVINTGCFLLYKMSLALKDQKSRMCSIKIDVHLHLGVEI